MSKVLAIPGARAPHKSAATPGGYLRCAPRVSFSCCRHLPRVRLPTLTRGTPLMFLNVKLFSATVLIALAVAV